jgi:hypothetical protein
MRKTLLATATFLSIICGSVSTANAEYTEVSVNVVKDAITSFNQRKQTLINDKDFFYKAVSFYHSNIDDRAIFKITINDPRTEVPQQSMKLNKTQYLQGFLKEGQRLESYRQDYKINDIISYGKDNIFMAQETIMENAIVPPMMMGEKKSTTFSAQTNCNSIYQIQGGKAIQLGSDCATTIGFPREI